MGELLGWFAARLAALARWLIEREAQRVATIARQGIAGTATFVEAEESVLYAIVYVHGAGTGDTNFKHRNVKGAWWDLIDVVFCDSGDPGEHVGSSNYQPAHDDEGLW